TACRPAERDRQAVWDLDPEFHPLRETPDRDTHDRSDPRPRIPGDGIDAVARGRWGRRGQRWFGRASAAAMLRAVGGGGGRRRKARRPEACRHPPWPA